MKQIQQRKVIFLKNFKEFSGTKIKLGKLVVLELISLENVLRKLNKTRIHLY